MPPSITLLSLSAEFDACFLLHSVNLPPATPANDPYAHSFTRELAGFSWKRLMWADMAASGARLGEGDRAQHRRGPPGARRLHSPLELLVHLFEVASGPPVPGRAGEVAFLQYLFMVLRVDLDARLQVGRRWGREG